MWGFFFGMVFVCMKSIYGWRFVRKGTHCITANVCDRTRKNSINQNLYHIITGNRFINISIRLQWAACLDVVSFFFYCLLFTSLVHGIFAGWPIITTWRTHKIHGKKHCNEYMEKYCRFWKKKSILLLHAQKLR